MDGPRTAINATEVSAREGFRCDKTGSTGRARFGPSSSSTTGTRRFDPQSVSLQTSLCFQVGTSGAEHSVGAEDVFPRADLRRIVSAAPLLVLAGRLYWSIEFR